MHPQLQAIFDYFDIYDIAIAGGAAVDLVKASDIDVLFLAHNDFGALCKRLAITYQGWDTPDGRHIRTASFSLPGVRRPIQLIQDGSPSFEDYLKFVDISTHQCCLLRDGNLLKGKDYTPPDAQPKLLHVTSPTSSQRRYERVCARYGHKP
jgi:hypothetical protein